MQLMTPQIEDMLTKSKLNESRNKSSNVIVKYFTPIGPGTWLITAGKKMPDGDWLLWGYCHIFEWEWGYVSLSELEAIEFGGLGVERDLYAHGTVADLCVH